MSLSFIDYPHLDPMALRLGPVAIRWYGIAYLLGFALAYIVLRRLIQYGKLRITESSLSDLIGWLVAGVMIGGRAGWWLFYHRKTNAAEPWYELVAIWHGGMSFHGALIGVTAALFFWSWLKHAPTLNIADSIALAAPLGLFFGRIANFINAELVGRPTGLPWGVVFPRDSVPRHPSQLYEALLEGLILLIVLWLAFLKLRPRDGRITALFLMCYGTFRFAVEFSRQPDEQLGFIAFGWLTMGQLLSTALIVAGIAVWIRCRLGTDLVLTSTEMSEASRHPRHPNFEVSG